MALFYLSRLTESNENCNVKKNFKMKYGIFGTFSVQLDEEKISAFNVLKEGFFSGTIVVDDEGQFSGELEDSYGKSTITGKMDEKEISFQKKYSNSKGHTYDYFLLRRGPLIAWGGSWNYLGPDSGNEGHKGQAICSLFLVGD